MLENERTIETRSEIRIEGIGTPILVQEVNHERPIDLVVGATHTLMGGEDAASLGAALIRHARERGVDIEATCDFGRPE